MIGFRVWFCLAFFLSLLWFPPSSFATNPVPPSDATGRCNVIHAYEGLCGNSRPSPCMGKPGIDYYTNLSHQKIWDDYFWLCVNVAPSKDRYSHECIDFYSLAATCTSTVEDLVEYTAVTTLTASYTPPAAPSTQYVANTTIVAYACGLFTGQGAKVDAYKAACGDIVPADCSGNDTVVSDYRVICGEKRPCDCVSEKHCGPACPIPSALPEPPPAPVAPPPAPIASVPPVVSPGSGGSGGSLPPPGSGLGAPNVGSDSAIAFGAGDTKSPGGSGTSNAEAGKGCSLDATAPTPNGFAYLLLPLLLLGILNRRKSLRKN